MNHEEAKRIADWGLECLAKELAAGRSQRLLDYLAAMGRFHNYSFGNVLLIAFQRSEATHVAGFNVWKRLGRYVKKGEKGIAILAPLVHQKKLFDGEQVPDGEPVKVQVLRGFRVVYVFDVSQTEGKPLPEFARVAGDPGVFTDRLKALIARHRIALSYEPVLTGALGKSLGGEIVLRPDLTPAQEFSVLVHELAHELLHKGERRKDTTPTIRETEAEAVAYVVSQAIGLDTAGAAADYIQLYAGTTETLADSLNHIQRVSAEIIRAVLHDVVPAEGEVAHVA